MAHRANFRKDEIAAFTAGAKVEWLHGSRWTPGEIVTGTVERDSIRGKYMEVRNLAATPTLSRGMAIWGTPGAIRLAQ